MRIEKFQVEKYGAVSDRTIDLTAAHGLVVIYGPNEAGKSTLLSSLTDFFFGIPQQSPHGQVFGYDQMRITATLALASGDERTLRRLKARGARALVDAENQPVDEVTLSTILGGTTRDKFLSLFGLNHASLRSGGERLLAVDGDIGRLIVEAGGGLRSLVSRLSALSDEANSLFAQRKSADRAFYPALEAFLAAERDAKAAILTREAFDQAKKVSADSAKALADIRSKRADIFAERMRLERLIRVAPTLGELVACDEVLATLDDVGQITPTFPDELEAALTAEVTAESTRATKQEKLTELDRLLAEIVVPEGLLSSEAVVRDVIERSGHVAKARGERRNRDGELQSSETKLLALRRAIGVAEDANLEVMLPTSQTLASVQEKAERSVELRTQLKSLVEQLGDDDTKMERLRARANGFVAQGQDKALVIKGADFVLIPAVENALRVNALDLEDREKSLEGDCDALGLGTVDAIANVLWPDSVAIQTEMEQRAGVARDISTVETARNEARSRHAKALRDLERLARGDELPTPTAIVGARGQRDAAWTNIRRSFVDQSADAWTTAPLADRSESVDAFEAAKSLADRLSDRKGDEAQRLAEAQLAESERDEASARISDLDNQMKRLIEQRDGAIVLWDAAWSVAVALAPELPTLKALTEKRQALFARVGDLAIRREKLATEKKNLGPMLISLSAAEKRLRVQPDTEAAVADRVTLVVQQIADHEAGFAEWKATATELSSLEIEHQRRCGRKVTADAALMSWTQEWAVLMPQIGLPTDASPQVANQVATQWAGADGVLDALKLTRRRLTRMDEDEAKLKKLIDDLRPTLGFTLPTDSVAAAEMLSDRWDEGRELAKQRDVLAPQRTAAEADVTRAEGSLTTARKSVDDLCVLASCERAGVRAVAERCQRRSTVLIQQGAATTTLRAAGDGYTLDELREQLSDSTQDSLRVAMKLVEETATDLDRRHEEAVLVANTAETALRLFMNDEHAASTIALREGAASDLARISERYVELTLARRLLEIAIERVRKEQQNPLLQRASALFALSTRGAFSGIETDVDEKGVPIVIGVRVLGGTVRVGEMSDGTRDQLYLSFRLASLEHYGKATEPLPFIADDVLVHFDDERAAATMDLLAAYGEASQVILFTHHESVRGLGARLEVDGRATVVSLS